MNVPADLKYTAAHHWVRQEPDGTLAVGITFHAQEELGDIVFVQPPDAGRRLARDEVAGVIESVKTAADLHAPLSGVVVTANPEAAAAPERINTDPYGTWLFRMRPDDPGAVDALLDAAAYEKISGEDTQR